jgi:hypothetical protein
MAEEFRLRQEAARRQAAEQKAIAEQYAKMGLRLKKLPREYHHGMDYYVFKKGRITNEKEVGVWHRDGDTVFIRCLACLTILKIDWSDINEDGVTGECLICTSRRCRMHQYIKFKDFWDKEEKADGRR